MDDELTRRDKVIAYPSGYQNVNRRSHVLQKQARDLVKLRSQVSFWRWMSWIFFASGSIVASVAYYLLFVWHA